MPLDLKQFLRGRLDERGNIKPGRGIKATPSIQPPEPDRTDLPRSAPRPGGIPSLSDFIRQRTDERGNIQPRGRSAESAGQASFDASRERAQRTQERLGESTTEREASFDDATSRTIFERDILPGEPRGGLFTPQPIRVEEDRQGFRRITNPGGGQFLIDTEGKPVQTPRSVSTARKAELRGGTFFETGKEVDHVIPKALGGTDENPNLQVLKNKKNFSEAAIDFITRNQRLPGEYQPENRQEGKMVIEWEAIRQVDAGLITQEEARAAVVDWQNPETTSRILGMAVPEPKEQETGTDETAKRFLDRVTNTDAFTAPVTSIAEFIKGKHRRFEENRDQTINEIKSFLGFKSFTPEGAMEFPVGEGLDEQEEERATEIIRRQIDTAADEREVGQAPLQSFADISPQDPAGVRAAKGVLAPARFVLGEPIRFIGSLMREFADDDTETVTQENVLTEAFFGPEPITRITESEDFYGTVQQWVQDKLEEKGLEAGPAEFSSLAATIAIGAVIENPFSFGGGKKAAKETVERALTDLTEKELGEVTPEVQKIISRESERVAGLEDEATRAEAVQEAYDNIRKETAPERIVSVAEGRAERYIESFRERFINELGPESLDNLRVTKQPDGGFRITGRSGDQSLVAGIVPDATLLRRQGISEDLKELSPERVKEVISGGREKIEIQPGLSADEARIERETQMRASRNYEEFKQEYIRRNADIDDDGEIQSITLNTDDWRELFDEYVGTNAHTVHEASSYLNKRLMSEMLERQAGKGNNTLAIYAGGGGSGKGTAVKKHFDESEFPVILDQTFEDLEKSLKKIREAQEKFGYNANVIFVDREAAAAFSDGVVARALSKREAGAPARTVPINRAVDANISARENMLRLLREKEDIPVEVIDNNRGRGNSELLTDPEKKIRFLEREQADAKAIKEELYATTLERYRRGEIPADIAAGLGIKEARAAQRPIIDAGKSAAEREAARETADAGTATARGQRELRPDARAAGGRPAARGGAERLPGEPGGVRGTDVGAGEPAGPGPAGGRQRAEGEAGARAGRADAGADEGPALPPEPGAERAGEPATAERARETTAGDADAAATERKSRADVLNTPYSKADAPADKAYPTIGTTNPTPAEREILESADDLTPTKLDEGKQVDYLSVKDLIHDNWWLRTREFVEDSWVRVKKLQKSPYTKMPGDEANPYLAETLFHGRVGARLEDIDQRVKDIDLEMVRTAKAMNVPVEDFQKEVDAYLHWRHAPERNTQLGKDGAAGVTTEEAEAGLKDLAELPHFDNIVEVSEQLQLLNNETLDVLFASQVIDDQTKGVLRQTYQNHVPLQRVFDEDEPINDVLLGRGLDVKTSGIKRAKGSRRAVADITGNITANVKSALIRAEKNRVDLATLKFARANKDLGIFEEVKPKVIGKDPSGKPLFERVDDPLVLTVRENGKPVHLRIKDEKLAMAFKGVNHQHLPRNMLFRAIEAFTRTYSGIHTRFNPEFAFSNKIRDIQELAVYTSAQEGMGFGGTAKALGRDHQSVKAVVDWMRGKTADNELARLYEQMRKDGGTTGGLALSTRKQVEVDIEKIRRLNRSNPRQAADTAIRAVDAWNTVFEDSTRLSVYRTALERGMSREQAALLAKNSSINFNKKGIGGPIINSLWMFSNASIQGSAKMLRSMRDPKVAAAVTSAVGFTVWSTNAHNDAMDPNWRDKVTQWDRNANVVVLLPSDEGVKYVTVPVSWGLKPIKVAMDYLYDAGSGHSDGFYDAASGIVAATLEGYNPIGGTDIGSALTPTFLDLPADIRANKAWHGGKIRPDWNRNLPQSWQFFDETRESATGRAGIAAAQGLASASNDRIQISPENIIYAYEQLVGGAGRFVTRTFNSLMSFPDPPPLKDIPAVNRFLKSKKEDEIRVNSKELELVEYLSDQAIERKQLRLRAQDIYAELKGMEPAEANARLRTLFETDREAYDRVVDMVEEDQLGLTTREKKIRQLGVENGSRAAFIYDELKRLDAEDANARLAELVEKRVVTDQVLEQIRKIREEEQSK